MPADPPAWRDWNDRPPPADSEIEWRRRGTDQHGTMRPRDAAPWWNTYGLEWRFAMPATADPPAPATDAEVAQWLEMALTRANNGSRENSVEPFNSETQQGGFHLIVPSMAVRIAADAQRIRELNRWIGNAKEVLRDYPEALIVLGEP